MKYFVHYHSRYFLLKKAKSIFQGFLIVHPPQFWRINLILYENWIDDNLFKIVKINNLFPSLYAYASGNRRLTYARQTSKQQKFFHPLPPYLIYIPRNKNWSRMRPV